MRASQILGGIAVAATAFSGSAAIAGPITLAGGANFGKFSGVEQINFNGTGFAATSGTTGADCAGCIPVAPGTPENVFGVFVVSDLEHGVVNNPNQNIAGGGSQYFASGGGVSGFGNEVVGVFYGENITSAPGQNVTTKGGVLDLYWWDSNNQSQASLEAEGPAGRTSQTQYTNVTCGTPVTNGATGCQFLARLDLVPGTLDNGVVVNPNVTAQANTNLDGTAGGNSTFYLEVDLSAGGAWANQLASNWFQRNFNGFTLPDFADVRAQYDFTHCAGGTGATGDCSLWGSGPTILGEEIQDPVKFFVNTPEPATLTLLGTALLGLGARRRRNRK